MKKDRVLETSTGVKLRYQPVSHIQMAEIGQIVHREFRERDEPITPPTYEVTLAGGAVVEYEHKENTLDYPIELALKETDDEEEARRVVRAKTLEARQAWAEYQDALQRMQIEINERTVLYMLDEGIVPDSKDGYWDGVVPEEWVKRQERMGFKVPEDEYDRVQYYLLRAILRTPEDQMRFCACVAEATTEGLRDEQIDAALEFFRGEVEG